jgi:hypothetical protein
MVFEISFLLLKDQIIFLQNLVLVGIFKEFS